MDSPDADATEASEPADATASTGSPLSTRDALGRLDDPAFAEFVRTLWERRGWDVEGVRDGEPRHVDVGFQREWPVAERGLLRVERPESDARVGGTELRHFVRAVQGAEVDWSTLVLPREAPRSLRREATEFGVRVVDVDDLADLVRRREAYDLLTAHVDRPLVVEANPLVARAPAPVAGVLRRVDAVDRGERVLDRCLPPNPTADDVARLTFTAFRVSLSAVAATFALTLATPGDSVAFWLLMGAFLLVTYGGLLPSFAADIYYVRRFDAGPWTPTWWLLAGFLLAPTLFAVGGLYWYRRRHRTRTGRTAAWGRDESESGQEEPGQEEPELGQEEPEPGQEG